MGQGISRMDAVALWVASLPGSVGRIRGFGVGPLLLGTAGLLMLCLLRSPLRWSGAVVIVLAGFWALRTPAPDIAIAFDGRAVAVRGSDGRLTVFKTGNDSFVIGEWLAADADARSPRDANLGEGAKCDGLGCIARLSDGRFVALALSPEAFADDCRRAALVVTPGNGPLSCDAVVSDRASRLHTGAVTLRWNGDGFAMTPARPAGYDRPWARARGASVATPAGDARPTLPDATPRTEDLGPGD
jgi:competence protein ComEC